MCHLSQLNVGCLEKNQRSYGQTFNSYGNEILFTWRITKKALSGSDGIFIHLHQILGWHKWKKSIFHHYIRKAFWYEPCFYVYMAKGQKITFGLVLNYYFVTTHIILRNLIINFSLLCKETKLNDGCFLIFLIHIALKKHFTSLQLDCTRFYVIYLNGWCSRTC